VSHERILVISDTHYPLTDEKEILGIIGRERPDKLIVLGDIAESPSYAQEFMQILRSSSCKDQVFIRGDNDAQVPALKSYKMNLDGRELVFIHGHQYNVVSERFTKRLAYFLKKFNRNLPVFGYALYSRVKSGSRRSFIFLGHSHALVYFPRLRVASCGCQSSTQNVYNDRGYLTIESRDARVELSVYSKTGTKKTFEI
jgi:predicted phosphodiesterase